MKTERGVEAGSAAGQPRQPWLADICVSVGILLWMCVVSEALSQVTLYDPSFEIAQGADGPVDSILMLDDGRILVGGQFTTIAGRTNRYLARLLSNGQVDTSFDSAADGSVWSILKQPDGKVLIGGSFDHIGGYERHGVARLLTNGLVDIDFNPNGSLTTNDWIWSVGCQPDGKVLVGSYRVLRLQANEKRTSTGSARTHSVGMFVPTTRVQTAVFWLAACSKR